MRKSKSWSSFSILQNPKPVYPILVKLVIWLGNPWKQYHNTRHNIGFMIVDMLFTEWKEEKKFKSLISHSTTLNSQSWVIAVKPQTFMNLSGEAVSALVSFYKIDPTKDILIISDDIDMEFWKIRFRSEWSHGGQNGLRGIIAQLGTNQFSRIKIGIGRDERYSVSDWVLSRLTDDEMTTIQTEISQKVEAYIKKWLCD